MEPKSQDPFAEGFKAGYQAGYRRAVLEASQQARDFAEHLAERQYPTASRRDQALTEHLLAELSHRAMADQCQTSGVELGGKFFNG